MSNPKNNVKFLMILNHIDWFWSHRLPLAKGILGRGWDLHAATHGADKDQAMKNMGVVGHDLPKVGKGSDIIGQIKLLWSLFKTIKELQPDIIHAITIRYAFYAGIVTRLMFYKPVTFTLAGLGSLYTAPGLKMKLIRAVVTPLMMLAFRGEGRFIIFQNPDDRNALVNAGVVKAEQTTIIRGSGVDISEFEYSLYVKIDEEPIILFTSRLLKEKGIYDFIEAAKVLKSKGVKARFVVAGDVYPDNARSLTREEMIFAEDAGVIEWLGQVEDMPNLLKRAMMVVLPSYYGEGVPKVLLETAAIGRPIITCDTPGCREAVEHEVNGELIQPQSPRELVEVIERLINEPETRQAYGAAGRKRMEEDFHVESVVSRTMAVYDGLL